MRKRIVETLQKVFHIVIELRSFVYSLPVLPVATAVGMYQFALISDGYKEFLDHSLLFDSLEACFCLPLLFFANSVIITIFRKALSQMDLWLRYFEIFNSCL